MKSRSSSALSAKVKRYKAWAAVRNDTGFRSQFEADVSRSLPDDAARYEAVRIPYTVTTTRHYTPDWLLPRQAIVLEAKGRFTLEDRNKMLMVKAQYPKLDIRLIFQRLSQKVTKTMTVQDWCDKHGFPCCKGPAVPDAWLKHKPTAAGKKAFAALFPQVA